MRKWLPLLVLALLLICVSAAADVFTFESIMATIEIPSDYVVLTPENLQEYSLWLESNGRDIETVTNDFLNRNVLLQAISEDQSQIFELRAVQTEESLSIFDVNEQSEAIRKAYRIKHKDNELEHYTFSDATWTKAAKTGRFLVLPYTYRDNGEVLYRGYMRRTIRNGYEIDLDMQVYGRSATKKDNSALNKIWDTFRFAQVFSMPAKANAKINFTTEPPTETKSASFKIAGTAAEGVKLTTVLMGLSSTTPTVTTTVVEKNGKFSIPVKLPNEGVFLITITADYQEEEVGEYAFPVTYQRTMLAVNFTDQPDSVVKEDEVRIAGTAEPSAEIQVFLDGDLAYTKHVTAAGKFALYTDVTEEGEHQITVVFNKAGLEDRRFTFSFNRKWSTADQIDNLKSQAVKPAYSTLVKKIANYEGKTCYYSGYITDITKSGEDYIVRMALKKSSGKYSNYILVTASEEPSFSVGEKVQMFGTCEGMSLPETDDDGSQTGESIPCFDLLLFASVD